MSYEEGQMRIFYDTINNIYYIFEMKIKNLNNRAFPFIVALVNVELPQEIVPLLQEMSGADILIVLAVP